MHFLVAVVLLSGGLLSCSANGESLINARGGIIIIPDDDDGSVRILEGKWRFTFGALVEDKDIKWDRTPDEWMQARGVWNGTGNPARMGDGSATYAFLISNLRPDRSYAILLRPQATSFSLFINGLRMGSSGKPGLDRNSTVPGNNTVKAFFTAPGGVVRVVLHVANYHSDKGGLWESFYFGSQDEIVKLCSRNLLKDSFFTIFMALAGVFFLMQYSVRSKNKDTLFLGLFSLFFSLRQSVMNSGVLMVLLPDIPWQLTIRFEITAGVLAVLFLLILYRVRCRTMFIGWYRVSLFLSLLFTMLTIVLPVRITGMILFLYQLVILNSGLCALAGIIRSWKSREPGALSSFAAVSVMILLTVHDALYADILIFTGPLLPYAVCIFIILQTAQYSEKTARALDTLEALDTVNHKRSSI